MKCLALDDEPLALKVLENYVQQLTWLLPQGFYTNPHLAKARLEKGDIDLLFLDIQMPDITGLQFLKDLGQPPMVIFSTAYRQFAVEGFELEAVDYLVKPYAFERFEKAVQRAEEYLLFKQNRNLPPSNDHIFVKSAYKVLKIKLDDLYLVETLDDYLKLHLRSQPKPVLTLMTMKGMEEQLPMDKYLRVHRSFLVALDAVKGRRNKLLEVGAKEVPIGKTYFEEVSTMFR